MRVDGTGFVRLQIQVVQGREENYHTILAWIQIATILTPYTGTWSYLMILLLCWNIRAFQETERMKGMRRTTRDVITQKSDWLRDGRNSISGRCWNFSLAFII
jgi:hypothetical protein